MCCFGLSTISIFFCRSLFWGKGGRVPSSARCLPCFRLDTCVGGGCRCVSVWVGVVLRECGLARSRFFLLVHNVRPSPPPSFVSPSLSLCLCLWLTWSLNLGEMFLLPCYSTHCSSPTRCCCCCCCKCFCSAGETETTEERVRKKQDFHRFLLIPSSFFSAHIFFFSLFDSLAI